MRPEDLNELKRIATNAHSEDKARWNRILSEINALSNKVKFLETENANLKKIIEEKGL
jgi:hypothetical protein